jgi:hypothetical protein
VAKANRSSAEITDGLTEDQVVNLLITAKGNEPLETFAPKLNASFQYVARVIARDRKPGPKILKWLGLRKKVTYERIAK